MNKLRSIFGVVLLCGICAVTRAEPMAAPLWPDKKPDENGEKVRELTKGKVDRFISNVTVPVLYVHLPPADKANGAAVVICPGGAYVGVAIDREGHDVARWLNSIGVAGIVLKYRMPNPAATGEQIPWPLQDAQRAIRLVRQRAAEWKIDPNRVGIMGFSAGGHLASTAGTHFDAGKADAQDPIEQQSCRPDFIILGYPVITFNPPIAHTGSRDNLLGKNADATLIEKYSNELQVTAQTPPAFLVHARDDGVNVENSIQFAEAMKKAGVPCELQLYDKGGHGYGLGMNGGEVAGWPAQCEKWMRSMKLLEKPAGK